MVNGWKRARCDTGHCVEVLDNYGTVLIRSSESPEHYITVDSEEWEQFIEAVKKGEFDS